MLISRNVNNDDDDEFINIIKILFEKQLQSYRLSHKIKMLPMILI